MKVKQGRFGDEENPDEFKWYNFGNPEVDPEIPVVLGFVTRDFTYPFGEQPGAELLLLRRSFRVGAMQGYWTPVAGVDDFVATEEKGDADTTKLSMIDEFCDEIGLNVEPEEITLFAANDYPDPVMEGRVWKQQLFHVHKKIDKVTIDWESTGAIWIPLTAIDALVNNGTTDNPSLNGVLRDGTKLIEDGNLRRFLDYYQSTYLE